MGLLGLFQGSTAKKRKKWACILSGLTQGTFAQNFKRFGRKLREEIGFFRKWLICPFWPIAGPMGKNRKKWASTFVGTNPGNMCTKFQKILKKTEGGDKFSIIGLFLTNSGPMDTNCKSGLVLLSGLTQGTCVPIFKGFGRKLKEEIGF